MANRRDIVKRRKAVRNIRKITRTMQLIATARYQSSYRQAAATKDRSAMVVITSARGLAGGYNTNVLRSAFGHLDEQQAAGVDTDVTVARKKGITSFRFVGRKVSEELPDVSDMPSFAEIEPLANRLMERFIAGEIGSVYVAYTHFHSTARQRPAIMKLLPLSFEAGEGEAPKAVEFEFSPEPAEILGQLLPSSVRMRLYQAFTEAAVSEQIARMVAMKQATDAAEEKIKQLTRAYNRARQTAITMELLDIVGGASALA